MIRKKLDHLSNVLHALCPHSLSDIADTDFYLQKVFRSLITLSSLLIKGLKFLRHLKDLLQSYL